MCIPTLCVYFSYICKSKLFSFGSLVLTWHKYTKWWIISSFISTRSVHHMVRCMGICTSVSTLCVFPCSCFMYSTLCMPTSLHCMFVVCFLATSNTYLCPKQKNNACVVITIECFCLSTRCIDSNSLLVLSCMYA